MHSLLALPLAAAAAAPAAPQPLFGNQWLALLAILAGVAVLLVLMAGLGRLLAASHPDPEGTAPAKSASSAPAGQAAAHGELPHDVKLAIAAAVVYTMGSKARIAAVEVPHDKSANVETLMAQWAMEGRRQIYTSHKVR